MRIAMLLSATLFAIAWPAAEAHAGNLIPELRIATTYQGKFDADVYTAAWSLAAPRWTGAGRLEISTGVIRDAEKIRPFAFVGPVWRLVLRRPAPFLEFSFGPTLIGGAVIDGRDLGGNLHFRSALALGTSLGRNTEIAIRIEHISNGGLRDENPGLDSIGLGFFRAF